jgi:hypothetical protein
VYRRLAIESENACYVGFGRWSHSANRLAAISSSIKSRRVSWVAQLQGRYAAVHISALVKGFSVGNLDGASRVQILPEEHPAHHCTHLAPSASLTISKLEEVRSSLTLILVDQKGRRSGVRI